MPNTCMPSEAGDNSDYLATLPWDTLTPDARAAAARAALTARHVPALCDMANTYLNLYGPHRSRTSDHTRRAYRIGIGMLLRAWSNEDLAAPSRDAAARWLQQLERAGASTSTVRVRMAAGRLLYRALRWAGAVQGDPFADVRAAPDPTPAWEKRQPYSEAEVAALLREADPLERAIVLLGAHAGLRISEMCALTWPDACGEVVVRHGKGGKLRRVALSGSLRGALAALPATTTGPVLGDIDAIAVRALMRNLCRRATVPVRGVHALRHSAGTKLYEATGDLQAVARHLGHSSVSTSAIYAKYADQRTRNIMDAW